MAGAEHLREGLIGDEPGNGEPALPITRQPAIFAIWSAALPTAPDAPETKTVSPPGDSVRITAATAGATRRTLCGSR